MSDNWVDGSLETGADEASPAENGVRDVAVGADDAAKAAALGEVGAGLGLVDGEPNSFEPEEADPAVGAGTDPGEDTDD